MQNRDTKRVLEILANNSKFADLVFDTNTKSWYDYSDEWSGKMLEVLEAYPPDAVRYQFYIPITKGAANPIKERCVNEQEYNILIAVDDKDDDQNCWIIEGGTVSNIASTLLTIAERIIEDRVFIDPRNVKYHSIQTINAKVLVSLTIITSIPNLFTT